VNRPPLAARVKEIGKLRPEERAEIVRMLGYEYPETSHDIINAEVKKFNGWNK
jgi:hypothetical protein